MSRMSRSSRLKRCRTAAISREGSREAAFSSRSGEFHSSASVLSRMASSSGLQNVFS